MTARCFSCSSGIFSRRRPYLWAPHDGLGSLVSRYAVGAVHVVRFTGFPFVPWLGVYVLATVLGERTATFARASEFRRGDQLLLRVGATATSIGAAISMARHGLRALAPTFFNAHGLVFEFLAAGRKFPPGPIYLLTFGGAGILLIGTAFEVARAPSWMSVARPLSAMGRASLFVFILQGYVYYLALPAIGLPYPQLWPAYYAATILFFLAAAAIWNAFDANRYLTVGLWQTMPIVKAVRARVRMVLVACSMVAPPGHN